MRRKRRPCRRCSGHGRRQVRACGRGRAAKARQCVPSLRTMKLTSSPSRNSSITSAGPSDSNRLYQLPLCILGDDDTFPAASPSALMTTGKRKAVKRVQWLPQRRDCLEARGGNSMLVEEIVWRKPCCLPAGPLRLSGRRSRALPRGTGRTTPGYQGRFRSDDGQVGGKDSAAARMVLGMRLSAGMHSANARNARIAGHGDRVRSRVLWPAAKPRHVRVRRSRQSESSSLQVKANKSKLQ